VIVLPLYAAQPLVCDIGASLGLPVSAYGMIAMIPMAGCAAGLFLLVPRADLLELRGVTLASVAGEILSLAATASAPNGLLFFIAAFAVGGTASAIQMLAPAAAGLVEEERRGRVIGMVMSGLMFGILLSRPAASLAAEALGWRGAFAVDAMPLAAVWVGLYRALPVRRPGPSLKYRALLSSLIGRRLSGALHGCVRNFLERRQLASFTAAVRARPDRTCAVCARRRRRRHHCAGRRNARRSRFF
jgi:predicted MFS family arabinose efflux permease